MRRDRLQILGTGSDGHIASTSDQLPELADPAQDVVKQTIDDNARFFEPETVCRSMRSRWLGTSSMAPARPRGERENQGQGDRPKREGPGHHAW